MPNYDKLFKLFETWFNTQDCYTEKTKFSYLRWITYFLRYLIGNNITRLNEVDEMIVCQFAYQRLHHSRYSTAYAEARLAALNLFFDWASQAGLSRGNPVLSYRKAQVKPQWFIRKKATLNKEWTILSEADIRQLIDLDMSCDFSALRDHCMVLLILASGISAEEVITLTPEALNLQQGLLSITGQTRRERTVPLDLSLCQTACHTYLKKRLIFLSYDNTLPLFILDSQKPFSRRQLHRVVSKRLQAANIQAHHSGPELLRQMAIVRMFKQGKTIEEIQAATSLSLTALEKYRQVADKS